MEEIKNVGVFTCQRPSFDQPFIFLVFAFLQSLPFVFPASPRGSPLAPVSTLLIFPAVKNVNRSG